MFKLEKSEDFPDMIEADTVRLERCLRNLLENALKYSDDDVRITVTLTMKNNHYRIAIKDTGWGIPKKAQKKLGQQFFRVKQADKPAQPGYGLGLSSVMPVSYTHLDVYKRQIFTLALICSNIQRRIKSTEARLKTSINCPAKIR